MTIWESITQVDGQILMGIQSALNADWLTPIMKFITMFGEKGIFSISVCILLMCFKKTRRLGILCAISVALTFLLVNLGIKPLVDRTRPWITFEGVKMLIPDPGDSSFPSGHSANVMSLAWAFWLGTKGKFPVGWGNEPCNVINERVKLKTLHTIGICLVIFALIIGLTRWYLGMHYPTDVIAGWLCGMLCATLAYWGYLKLLRKKGVVNED